MNVPSTTNRIPLIGAFYFLNMIIIAGSIFLCTLVVHIYTRGEGEVPPLLRKIFLDYLARILGMSTRHIELESNVDQQKQKIRKTSFKSKHRPVVFLNEEENCPYKQRSFKCTSKAVNSALKTRRLLSRSLRKSNDQPTMGRFDFINTNQREILLEHLKNNRVIGNDLHISFNLIENNLKEIGNFIRDTRKNIEKSEIVERQENEWKQIALVFDRVLFWIYLSAITVSALVLFFK